MSLAGLILSAGASRRMGSPKALLEIAGETFLDRLIGMMSSVCSPVVVVLGHDAETIRRGLQRLVEAEFVLNPNYEQGQLSSLQAGLAALPPDADGFLFTPVDYAGVRTSTVQAIVGRFQRRENNELFVIPRTGQRRGHPVCCARAVIREFLALPAGAQARDVVRRHVERTCYVDVEDPGILEDVDDPEAYQRLRNAFHAP